MVLDSGFTVRALEVVTPPEYTDERTEKQDELQTGFKVTIIYSNSKSTFPTPHHTIIKLIL